MKIKRSPMFYVGDKYKLIKEIKQYFPKKINTFIEPFVGGGNVICEIEAENKTGYDSNKCTIQALKLIRDNLDIIPKDNAQYTEDDYKKSLARIRSGRGSKIDCFASFVYSWGAKFCGGWRRDRKTRDHIAEAYRSAVKQSEKLKGVYLLTADYRDIAELDTPSTIYCDPPYARKTNYAKDKFNSDEFWEWCRVKTREGHIVIVSEYEAPSDFNIVFIKEQVNSLNDNKTVEKLFVHKDTKRFF
jgi:DNA adenine methylase